MKLFPELLCLGSQAGANQPALALVDTYSVYAQCVFRENLVGRIEPGMPAVVAPMRYPDQPITGRAQSVNWGTYQDDGSSGPEPLPIVRPTFEWIRPPQPLPVGVNIETVPQASSYASAPPLRYWSERPPTKAGTTGHRWPPSSFQ